MMFPYYIQQKVNGYPVGTYVMVLGFEKSIEVRFGGCIKYRRKTTKNNKCMRISIQDNIHKLYQEKVKNKIAFCKHVAPEFGVAPITMYQKWFAGFKTLPEEHEKLERMVLFLHTWIKNQEDVERAKNIEVKQ